MILQMENMIKSIDKSETSILTIDITSSGRTSTHHTDCPKQWKSENLDEKTYQPTVSQLTAFETREFS